MKNIYRIMILTVAMVLFASVQSRADSVFNLSTGTAPWQVVDKPSTDPTPLGPAVIITPHKAWNTSLVDADTKWVGINELGGEQGYGGDYVYRLDFALTDPGTCVVSGQFTSDNFVKSLKLNGVELLAAPQTEEFSFREVFSFNGIENGTLVLEAVVHNLPGSPPYNDPYNPTGFILNGQARVVPLPAAAWAGMSMLAGLGIIRKIRKH